MTEPMAADDICEHHYDTRILGGHPIAVRACTLCRTPDWNDLDEQAIELYWWGWQEGRAGKPARAVLSAYDKPSRAHSNPAASSDTADNPLRERLRAALRRFIDPDDDCMPALADDGVGFIWVTTDSVLDELAAAIDAQPAAREPASSGEGR